MSPEAKEILDKLLDQGGDWLRPIDVTGGTRFQHVTVEGSEIVTKRIEPEEFYQMPDDNPRHQSFKLTRRRESVTADEVIAKMREVPWPDQNAKAFCEAAIKMIEVTIAEICRPTSASIRG